MHSMSVASRHVRHCSRVFPIGALRLFCCDELKELFGSDQGMMEWTPEQLLHVFKFEHG